MANCILIVNSISSLIDCEEKNLVVLSVRITKRTINTKCSKQRAIFKQISSRIRENVRLKYEFMNYCVRRPRGMAASGQSTRDCSGSGRSFSARFRVVCGSACVSDDGRAVAGAGCFRRLRSRSRTIRCWWLRRPSPTD